MKRISNLSYLLVFSVLMILSACSKTDNTLNDVVDLQKETVEHTDFTEGPGLLLPESITEQNEGAIEAFVEGLTDEELTKYRNDFLVYKYLDEKSLLAEAQTKLGKNTSYSDLNLSDILSDIEVRTLENSMMSEINSSVRCCWNVYIYCGSYWCSCCGCIVDRYCYSHRVCH